MSATKEDRVTVRQFLNFVHKWTEIAEIYVVCGGQNARNDKVRDYHLTTNAYMSKDETERLLKYYGDVPLWNLCVSHTETRVPVAGAECQSVSAVLSKLCAHCSYDDVRGGRLAEREDIRKRKRKEYRENAKRRKAERMNGE